MTQPPLAVDRATPDYTRLPYPPDLVEWLRGEHATGHRMVLCTASDQPSC